MLTPSAYRDLAFRLAALRLLQPALDANYRAVTAATYPWPTASATPPERPLDAPSPEPLSSLL